MKAKSKSAKNRAVRNRKVRRKAINSAVLPVAVNASPDAGKAVIPVALNSGSNEDKVVPVAVRRSSGELVIPAEVNARGRRKRSVAIRVAVSNPAKRRNRRSRQEGAQAVKAAPHNPVPKRDPITNLLYSATRVEENAVTLAVQVGLTAVDVLDHWSRFLLHRGMRLAKATEQGMVEPAIRALEPPHLGRRPIVEAEVRFPAMRQPKEFKIAA